MLCIVRHTAAGFRARAEPWLLRREAEHNLLLGLAAQLEHSMAGYDPPIYLATIEQGEEIVGCAFRTPPFNLGITRLPPQAIEPLVADVAQVYDSLRGVLGADPEAGALARAWGERRGLRVREHMRERIYALERVLPPAPPPAGCARVAQEEDADLLVAWADSFGAETGVQGREDRVRELVASGRMEVWDDGGVCSMAAEAGATPHGARIGYVYTPPELRGRGYASACVAALSARELEEGRRFCFLYTDLSNPISNAIYQRIGYTPVSDAVDYRFEPPLAP